MTIAVGDTVKHTFVVDEAATAWFQNISGDRSLIHRDEAFARSRGFEQPIVYGGIMLAHLSHVLGMKLPGPTGTSTKWTINYRNPLYLHEVAEIELQVVNVSPSTGLVDCRFKIVSSSRTIATGTTQTIVPETEIDGGTAP